MLRLWRSKKETGSATRNINVEAGEGNGQLPSSSRSDQPSSVPPGEKTPEQSKTQNKAVLAWRKREARLVENQGDAESSALSPLFEIKQTIDVEAEHEALEAQLEEAEEETAQSNAGPPTDQVDAFAKKSGGLMARFLSKRVKNENAAVDMALMGAEGAAASSEDPVATKLPKPVEADTAVPAVRVSDSMTAQDAEQGFKRVPSKGSQASGAFKRAPSGAASLGSLGAEEDLYPAPEEEEEGDEEALQSHLGPGKHGKYKHDPSRERRRVAFDIEPRSLQRWKGLGLHDAVEESKTVQIRRAAEVSAETDASKKKEEVLRKAVTINRLGALYLTVKEAKGLPKIDDEGGCISFVTARLFSSEFTTKPDFEADTLKIYEKDKLARTLKVKWFAEYEIPVRHKDAWLECEVLIEEGTESIFGVGRHRMPVQEIMDLNGDTVDNWYSLKRANGSTASAAIHIAFRYVADKNDPKELALRARQDREALMADALPDIPVWISAWDVRCVLKFSEEITAARRAVVDALDEDSLDALRKAMKLVDEFSLNDEANAAELKERLQALAEEEAAQALVRKKIRELLQEPRTRVFYIKSSIQQLLTEAHACNLDNSCLEVNQGLELLKWCADAAKGITAVAGAGVGDGGILNKHHT